MLGHANKCREGFFHIMLTSFLIGSAGYPLLELIYRRRTHPAMALAGGLSLCALTALYRMNKRRPLWRTALMGGTAVTGVEYIIGRRWNRRFQIWDYRRTPYNFRGQICLPFFLVWCGLSGLTVQVMRHFRV